ncbi:MAG: LegC family aminotransferase [Burkholderiales bacterium]|nr:LegC family aminotransferase [Burkholderiales bacterium]
MHTDDVFNAITAVLGDNTPVALHEPEFGGKEWEYVKDCIDTGWVSSVGQYVDEFEARLAEFTGSRHAISVVNGTAALHAALLAAGVGTGDEVLLPSLSFVATANAITYCGAIPHFLDSEEECFGLDPIALSDYLESIADRVSDGFRNIKTGRRLAAVVPMHPFGHPVDMPTLLEVTSKYSLPVVEDAAESLGSTIDGKHTGTFGKLGALSFNGNKIITTGGGGAILTNDTNLARHLKHITTTAKVPHRWKSVHDVVGFNYRMPNINAALGCAQLERLPGMIIRKRQLADDYAEAFDGVNGIRFVRERGGCRSNYWLNAIVLDAADYSARDSVLATANDAGYQCRPIWELLHRLPMYSDHPRASLKIAERLEKSVINLPSSAIIGGKL